MRITNSIGDAITDFKSWEKAFCQADEEKHFKEEKSAYELAKHFTKGGVDKSDGLSFICNLMAKFGYNANFLRAEIEHESRFDNCGGRGRFHDMYILAESSNLVIPICIEAKVYEPFGNKISYTYNSALSYQEKHNKSKQYIRIESLCKRFFDVEINKKKKFDNNEEIGRLEYQLFYYLAGSITEAKKHSDIVFVPVLVYHEYEENDSNREAYEHFMDKLHSMKKESQAKDIVIYKGEIEGITIISCYATIGRI
jgi:hypothetical protein